MYLFPAADVPSTKLLPNRWFMASATNPLAAIANIPVQPSRKPAITRSAASCRGRRWCARTTACTDPNAEIAASCASRSVIPTASPAATDSRRWSSASASTRSASGVRSLVPSARR
jgi:hypothetical protein